MRYYVGLNVDTRSREVFRSLSIPTQETHGMQYAAVIGPFRTKQGAMFMRDCGYANPHCQTVAEAESLASK